MLPIRYAGLCETPLGILVHQWTEIGLAHVELSADRSAATIVPALTAAEFEPTAAIADFEHQLHRYFGGQRTTFAEIPIDPTDWSPFFADVYRACRHVGPGEQISYKELALRAGRPAAARAVGQAMARNRIPLVIPCHRIVGSSGRLTGFSAAGGIDTKRWLLDRESGQQQFADCS